MLCLLPSYFGDVPGLSTKIHYPRQWPSSHDFSKSIGGGMQVLFRTVASEAMANLAASARFFNDSILAHVSDRGSMGLNIWEFSYFGGIGSSAPLSQSSFRSHQANTTSSEASSRVLSDLSCKSLALCACCRIKKARPLMASGATWKSKVITNRFEPLNWEGGDIAKWKKNSNYDMQRNLIGNGRRLTDRVFFHYDGANPHTGCDLQETSCCTAAVHQRGSRSQKDSTCTKLSRNHSLEEADESTSAPSSAAAWMLIWGPRSEWTPGDVMI